MDYMDGIWDDGEWVSWDEIDSDLNEDESRTNSSSRRNRSQHNNPKRTNKQSKIDATKMRKPHMALHYKSAKLNKHFESYIEGITPTQIPEDISELFLEKIWNTMNESVKKDVKELFEVYRIKQWTATALMAGRLLENVLQIHIQYDLQEEGVASIGKAIEILTEHDYDPILLEQLNLYKEQRNNFMHSIKRAGSGEAKNLVVDVISITMSIHNIKP